MESRRERNSILRQTRPPHVRLSGEGIYLARGDDYPDDPEHDVCDYLGAFRLGLSAWQRGDATKEEYQRFRTASELMLRQVKSMVPLKIKTEKAKEITWPLKGNRGR